MYCSNSWTSLLRPSTKHWLFVHTPIKYLCYRWLIVVPCCIVPKLAKTLLLDVSKKEVDKALTVTENQSAMLSIENYISHMVQLMKAQTLLYNTGLFQLVFV